MKIGCHTVELCRAAFFNGVLSSNVRSMIVEHLVACQSCLKYYCSYAKQNEITAFLDSRFKKCITTTDLRAEINTAYEEAIEQLRGKGEVTGEFAHWVDYIESDSYIKVLQVKSVRDFVKEYNHDFDDGNTDYEKWAKFMAKKMCQKVDFLEDCFKKETCKDGKEQK